MANYTEDIWINVKARYDDLKELSDKIKDVTKQFRGMTGNTIKSLQLELKKSADPISLASTKLNEAISRFAQEQKVFNEAVEAFGQDSAIKNFGADLEKSKQELVDIVKTIKSIPALSKEIKVAGGFEEANKALEKFMLSLDPYKQKMAELKQQMESFQNQFRVLNAVGKDTGEAEKSIRRIKKQMDKLQESTQKSAGWISKLMGRIRNISIYRMIRSGIRWLTSGVSEGLQGLAIYNNEVNKSMSNINNSLGQIRNTLAISFASVLQALEPTITALSDALVDLINSFNLAMAKMQGKDFYTKAKKSADAYVKSAQKAQKLSFDTFEVLSGGDNKTPTQDLFEDGSVVEDANEMSNAFEHIFRIIQDVWGVVKQIIQDLKESGVLGILLDIVGIIAQIAGDLTHLLAPVIKSVLEQVQGALQIISGFLKLLTGDFEGAWNLIGNGFASMCNGIINLFVQLAGGIVKLLNLLFVKLNPFFWILKAFGIDVGQKIDNWTEGWSNWRLNWKPIKGYYNGGVPAQGDLFYMNERGPEALVNTGGSQTNVINIDQISEGMRRGFVQAIYDTGLLNAMQQGSSTIVVDKDVLGRTVAESAGFRNEVNRRNVSLNLR